MWFIFPEENTRTWEDGGTAIPHNGGRLTRVDMFGIQRPAAFGDVLLAAEANIINKKQDTCKIWHKNTQYLCRAGAWPVLWHGDHSMKWSYTTYFRLQGAP